MGFNYPATLCWDCDNACGGCPWADKFQPVDGWTADYQPVKAINGKKETLLLDSYMVKSCPLFVPDMGQWKRRVFG